eukprot:28560-Pelagococcus_subviridis.AAC.1
MPCRVEVHGNFVRAAHPFLVTRVGGPREVRADVVMVAPRRPRLIALRPAPLISFFVGADVGVDEVHDAVFFVKLQRVRLPSPPRVPEEAEHLLRVQGRSPGVRADHVQRLERVQPRLPAHGRGFVPPLGLAVLHLCFRILLGDGVRVGADVARRVVIAAVLHPTHALVRGLDHFRARVFIPEQRRREEPPKVLGGHGQYETRSEGDDGEGEG